MCVLSPPLPVPGPKPRARTSVSQCPSCFLEVPIMCTYEPTVCLCISQKLCDVCGAGALSGTEVTICLPNEARETALGLRAPDGGNFPRVCLKYHWFMFILSYLIQLSIPLWERKAGADTKVCQCLAFKSPPPPTAPSDLLAHCLAFGSLLIFIPWLGPAPRACSGPGGVMRTASL